MRPTLLMLLFASVASAQPTASALPELAGPDLLLSSRSESGVVLFTPSDWEPPQALVVAGIALDGVLVGGGIGVAVWTAVAVSDALPEAGLAAPAVIGLGGLIALMGAGAAVAGGVDLIRVAHGGDPSLARMFDPTRAPRRRASPPFPPPGRPPWGPPRY